jgi:predicted nucleic acid-binding protein
MTALTLDASAAVRAVMDSAQQPRLLDALAAASVVYAPRLIVAESANALWKYHRAGVIEAGEALARHAELMGLVDAPIDDGELFPEALAMANRHEHPVYDCVYALVSRRYAAPLASFDRRLLGLCERMDIDVEPVFPET